MDFNTKNKYRSIRNNISVLFISLYVPVVASSQSLYLGAMSVNKELSYQAGITYFGILDAGVSYYHQNRDKTNVGYIGGNIKLPCYYNVLKGYYYSTLLYGLFITGAVGAVKMPKPTLSNEIKTDSRLGSSFGAGIELMYFKDAFIIALPIEISLGKSFFMQSFDSQYVLTSQDYTLERNGIISIGLRFSYLGNRCKDYISNLQNGR